MITANKTSQHHGRVDSGTSPNAALLQTQRHQKSRISSRNQHRNRVMQQGSDQIDGGNQGKWDGLRRSIGGYVYGSGSNSPEGRGGRRQKIAEYVRAANELRQSYYSPNPATPTTRGGRWNTSYEESAYQQTSSEELMEYVSNGKEEIVLFPSYGRKRIKGQKLDNSLEGTHDPPAPPDETNREEDIVADVDIRGWIYTPHTALPPSRKNRLVMAAMAKLCGLPQIPSATPSVSASETTRSETTPGDNREQELVRASEEHSTPSAESSNTAYSTLGSAASKLPWLGSRLGYPTSAAAQTPSPTLSRAEIEQLHYAMQARLSPFLTTPAFHMPLTVFLYNATDAQSTTLRTDNLGHFAVRKPISFFPTHVRVLAGEELCAEEEIRYINPESGISLISDIDDTIKISGIGTGLREMFRNVFVREMSTMPVPGVAEWFNSLASPPLNVQVHYLSNSPWQLYPFLRELLIDHMKLPKGTWHLKKYSGFVQGIFEPVAERKKESLEGLMRDFPGRKWILVGDGGEGDLEVYTEVVKKWPGKVIAVYIRDVSGIGEKVVGTGIGSNSQKDFFSGNVDSNILPPEYRQRSDSESKSYTERSSEKSSDLALRRQNTLDDNAGEINEGKNTSADEIARKVPPPRPPKPRRLRSNSIPSSSVTEENLIDLGQVERVDSLTSLYDGREYGSPSPLQSQVSVPSRRNSNSSLYASRVYQNAVNPDMNASTLSLDNDSQLPKPLDKKAELWKKRWEYADEVLAEQGVLLRSWRVGKDVHEECLALAKAYLDV